MYDPMLNELIKAHQQEQHRQADLERLKQKADTGLNEKGAILQSASVIVLSSVSFTILFWITSILIK